MAIPTCLTLEEISERVREAEERGATEVCLQGGIHPKFDGDYYIDVVAAVRAGSPTIHIHAFSALEVFEGARRSEQDLATYLTRLKDAGLKTLPGTAAEILDDDVRAILCPDKINSDQWLEVHRTAHAVGLRSNITIMFGAIEGPDSWATHLLRTRDLQKETGGFTEFVPLPFVHMATPLFLRGRSRKGPTFREAVLMHAVARLHYATLIDNIQVSWVKMGVEGSRRILSAGANDLGGTLMDENISRAAGATHGQEMDVHALERAGRAAGATSAPTQHPLSDALSMSSAHRIASGRPSTRTRPCRPSARARYASSSRAWSWSPKPTPTRRICASRSPRSTNCSRRSCSLSVGTTERR